MDASHVFCSSRCIQIVAAISAAGLEGNCLIMAFPAPTPLARTLSENTFERSAECGLICEATLARHFC